MLRRTTTLFLLLTALSGSLAVAQTPSVFINRGILDDPATVGTGGAFKEVELADLNDDGRLDFILPQKQGGPGNGPPGPNKDILYLSQAGDLILAVDDLKAKFLLRSTAQAFIEPNPLDPLLTSRAYDIELADFDQDGALDILRPDRFGRVDIWWGHKNSSGRPDGTFRDRTDVLADFGPNPNQGCGGGVDGNYDDVDIVNLDSSASDTDLDFVVAQRQECGGFQSTNVLVQNLRSQGLPRQFIVRQEGELPSASTHSVSFGKVDDDNAFDIVLSEFQEINLFRGEPGSPFFFEDKPQQLNEVFEAGQTRLEAVVADLVDLNSDGCLDIFVAENTIVGLTHGVYFHSCSAAIAEPYPQLPNCGGVGEPACAFVPAPSINFAALGLTANYQGIYDARYTDLDDDNRVEIVVVNQNVDNSNNVRPTAVQVMRVSGRSLDDVTTDFMQSPSALEGGMGIEFGDLDNDGDPDMVLAGAVLRPSPIGPPTQVIRAASTVYENRTETHIRNRTLRRRTVVGIKELSAGDNVTVIAGGDVTFTSGGTILLTDGFVAAEGSTFRACTFDRCP